ncbi:MAG TPA: DsbA family oxidoreductase [Candidatus Avipropionibacterium avicola]|uniref:DsbA family oxidoreductase n=1 Tax=Candidatus Avipropionibacterium avicola TaxID=2840701 RepID=A0A9D1GXF1_9ACTN|nr:DsbA family oxidoreductase [Candidatus Avipropionibacterium avicola]
MKIEVWSDVVCPFCFLGRKNLQAALGQYEHADEVSVHWRSFQLDPSAEPGEPGSTAAGLAAKYQMPIAEAEANQDRLRQSGAQVGIDFRWDLVRPDNTFDAHRLVHIVAERAPEQVDALVGRLFEAHFTEGAAVSDHEVLVGIAAELGIDADQVRAALAGDDGTEAVRQDLAQAQAYGISGVPFFVIDQAYGVSGAQPPEVLVAAMEQAREAAVAGAAPEQNGDDHDHPSCSQDSCEA